MLPEDYKFLILNKKIKYPVVFCKQPQHFECLQWTLNDWALKCDSVRFPFRLVKKSENDFNEELNSLKNVPSGPQWEGNACYIHATVAEFLSWQNSDKELDPSNPLVKFPNNEYWCYSSYNHMVELFQDKDDILQAINWQDFGFSKTGKESTIWIGTKGAHTPCHMDSYGCNLVVQLIGKKLWVLFPPDDSDYLYPTRIPYEESSVFSSVHIPKPCLGIHPNFTKCHPYVVVLKPGDVLFVPHHWWHYVECQDVSISVNMWIDLDDDLECHLSEAIVKTLMTAFISTYEPNEGEVWLNPTEELVEANVPEEYLKTSIERLYLNQLSFSDESVSSDTDDKSAKRAKLDMRICKLSTDLLLDKANLQDEHVSRVPSIEFDELKQIFPSFPKELRQEALMKKTSKLSAIQQASIRQILDCFTHADVISVIAAKLKNKFL